MFLIVIGCCDPVPSDPVPSETQFPVVPDHEFEPMQKQSNTMPRQRSLLRKEA